MKATFRFLAPLFVAINCIDAITATIGISKIGIKGEGNIFIHLLYSRFGNFAPLVWLPFEALAFLGLLYYFTARISPRLLKAAQEDWGDASFFVKWADAFFQITPFALLGIATIGPITNVLAILL